MGKPEIIKRSKKETQNYRLRLIIMQNLFDDNIIGQKIFGKEEKSEERSLNITQASLQNSLVGFFTRSIQFLT